MDRIQLVDVSPKPPPPVLVHRPERPAQRPSPADTGPRVTAVQVVAVAPEPARGDSGAPVDSEGGAALETGPADAQATFARPPAGARPLRDPGRRRLPGRDESFVEGFRVRDAPSIEDRVLGVAAMLFGGGRPETCDDVRQRLIGAAPGLARDMDVERLQRLCTN